MDQNINDSSELLFSFSTDEINLDDLMKIPTTTTVATLTATSTSMAVSTEEPIIVTTTTPTVITAIAASTMAETSSSTTIAENASMTELKSDDEEINKVLSTTSSSVVDIESSENTNNISANEIEALKEKPSLSSSSLLLKSANTDKPLTPKLLPKLSTTTVATTSSTTKNTSSGQVVIIQGSAKTPIPIRIAAPAAAVTSAGQSNNSNKPLPIQLLKIASGTLIHLKNNKGINLTNLPNITKTVTDGQSPTIVIKTSGIGTTATTTSTQSIVTTEKQPLKSSIEMSKIKQAVTQSNSSSMLSPKTLTDNINTENTNTSSNREEISEVVTSTTTTATQQKSETEVPAKISESGESSGHKQIIIPHHVLKLAPNTSGSIKTIQIPGKSGLQYVRVMGTTGSVTKNSVTITTNASIIKDNAISTQSVSTVTPKIILNTKSSENISISGIPKILNKEVLIPQQQSTVKQPTKSVITTIPTFKKVNSNIKALPFIKDENAKSILIKKEKVESDEDNDESLLNVNAEEQKPINKKPQLVMVTKDFLKNLKSSSNDDKAQVDVKKHIVVTSPKILYSVLKTNQNDSMESIEDDNLSSSAYPQKHSPSPPNDGPRRKHCNCTKSQCLKLYCDCFANGEFCQDCNCKDCLNTLLYEGERQKAIKMCLDRNPNAFKPKITKARDQSDLRLHNKGCHCKRSGCLKNYCECYEAKITCSSNCKCLGCRNVEDRSELDNEENENVKNFSHSTATKRSYSEMLSAQELCGSGDILNIEYQPSVSGVAGVTSSLIAEPIIKQPYNFITEEVVDATVQCMFAQMEECKKTDIGGKMCERMIVEELGKCLVEIIDFSIRNTEN